GGSAAAGITGGNITNWNTAFGWGDHSTEGYLTSEVDGSVTNELQSLSIYSNAYTYTVALSDGGGSVKLGRGSAQNLTWNGGTGELGISGGNTVDLDGRYLQSYTESDPVFSGSAAAGITGSNITNWKTAFGWGDHSTEGYLTSEVDGSASNEGSLTVSAGTSSTSVINSNTVGSTPVTISDGGGVNLTESGNTITISGAPDEVGYSLSIYAPSEGGTINVDFESRSQMIIEVNLASVTSGFTMNVMNGWSQVTSAGIYNVRFYNNGAGD